MKPIPLHPNLPTPTTAFGNPAPIAQYYICPHCKGQSPLVREWVGMTKEEAREICMANRPYVVDMVVALEARLKQKNGYDT